MPKNNDDSTKKDGSVLPQDETPDVETPAPQPKEGPTQDPNGGPQSTDEVLAAEAKQKQDSRAGDKEAKRDYLDINNPAHANKTYNQLQDEA